MNKKVLAALAAITCLSCLSFSFAGCQEKGHVHSYVKEDEIVVAPTCTKGGYTQHNCTDCDYFYRDNFTDPTGVHIPETDEAVPATCTSDGLTEGSHCKDCNTVLVAQQAVTANGHAYTYTCNADGYEHTGECDNCDAKVTNASHFYIDNVCIDCGYEIIESGDFRFGRFKNGTSYILNLYTSTKKDVVIPSSFNGLPVTEINDSAFNASSVESVVIPEGVTKIGNHAFSRCYELESVTIPSSITQIGLNAFLNCPKLIKNNYEGNYYLGNQSEPYLYLIDHDSENIFIHSQTKVISYRILMAEYDTDIVLQPGNTTFKMINNCLININTKTLVRGNENSVIPTNGSVTAIDTCAFHVPIAEFNVEIPDAINTIKEFAFYNTNKMTTLHIPAGVKVIENGAFYGIEGLEEITVDSANTNYYSNGNCLIEKSTKLLVRGCNNSVIPDGIPEIADYAFTNSKIQSIELPDSVKKIGNTAFENCKELSEVKTGKGLTDLDISAFLNCNSLQTLYLPSTLTSIGYQALKGINNLTINYDGTAAMWESIEKDFSWNSRSHITVHCTDNTVTCDD